MTKLEGTVKTEKDKNIIQKELLNLTDRINRSGMKFNNTKCKVMLLLVTETSVLNSGGRKAGPHCICLRNLSCQRDANMKRQIVSIFYSFISFISQLISQRYFQQHTVLFIHVTKKRSNSPTKAVKKVLFVLFREMEQLCCKRNLRKFDLFILAKKSVNRGKNSRRKRLFKLRTTLTH